MFVRQLNFKNWLLSVLAVIVAFAIQPSAWGSLYSKCVSSVEAPLNARVAEPLKGTIFETNEFSFPPTKSDPLADIGKLNMTNPRKSLAVAQKRQEAGKEMPREFPRTTVNLRTKRGLERYRRYIEQYKQIYTAQRAAKDRAKEHDLPKPDFGFNVSGGRMFVIEQIEGLLESLARLDAKGSPLTPAEKEIRRMLLIGLDRLGTGLSRKYGSPVPPDNSIAKVFGMAIRTKFGSYNPGKKPQPSTVYGFREGQIVSKEEGWRRQPEDSIIWRKDNVAQPTDSLYVPSVTRGRIFMDASDANPKTGFGAHWGTDGKVRIDLYDQAGNKFDKSIGHGKFRLGNGDLSRIEHRGEAQTGPTGVGFAKALGFNTVDISFHGDLVIRNDKPGAIREIFKTSNIKSEFGWDLRAWTDGPIVPFTGMVTGKRQKYYNPFTVVTKVVLKDGREITDWKEFQSLYYKGSEKSLTKKHKGEQKDENYNVEFERQIAHIEVGPMSVEFLPPGKRKDLEKQQNKLSKLRQRLDSQVYTSYETNIRELLESPDFVSARKNLFSLDTNSNGLYNHRSIRELVPLITMLQAWDIRPENLRVTVYMFRDGTYSLAIRFSDWGSVLGKANGFTKNTNADPNRYPIDMIKKVDRDRNGNRRVVLNFQGNSVSKASMHADYDSIKAGFARIGRLTREQVFQLIANGQYSAPYTYVMAQKFLMARDRALEKLFTKEEIEAEFGGFLAVHDNGQRMMTPEKIYFSGWRNLPILHNGQKIAEMKADGSYVKEGVYYMPNGVRHDPTKGHR